MRTANNQTDQCSERSRCINNLNVFNEAEFAMVQYANSLLLS